MHPTIRPCSAACALAALAALLAPALAAGCKDAPSSTPPPGNERHPAAAPPRTRPGPESRPGPQPPTAPRRPDAGPAMGAGFRHLKQVAAAQSAGLNAFSLALYRQVPADAKGNRFLSPWSVANALQPLLLGARGDTEKEMRLALRATLPGLEPHAGLQILNLRVLRAGGHPGTKLRLACRAWAAERYPIVPAFEAQIRRYYAAELGRLDFAQKNAEALKAINDWISGKTQGRIPKLLETLAVDTRLVLASAVYFLGQWLERFPAAATRPEPFTTFQGKVPAPLMRQVGTFRYVDAEGVKVVSLPYQGKAFSMLILLPAPGKPALEALEGRLDADLLTRLRASLLPTRVSVLLPRFRLRFRAQLRHALQALGMRRAFSGQADFTGITSAKEPFWIDQVIHEAYVDVNEKGTEAAAATAVTSRGGGPPAPLPELRADRPFLFVIQHDKSGAVLFVGRVGTPMSAP